MRGTFVGKIFLGRCRYLLSNLLDLLAFCGVINHLVFFKKGFVLLKRHGKQLFVGHKIVCLCR